MMSILFAFVFNLFIIHLQAMNNLQITDKICEHKSKHEIKSSLLLIITQILFLANNEEIFAFNCLIDPFCYHYCTDYDPEKLQSKNNLMKKSNEVFEKDIIKKDYDNQFSNFIKEINSYKTNDFN